MDAIDTFKTAALDSMSTTVTALKGEIDQAQTYLARVRATDDKAGDGSGSGNNGLDLGTVK
jgi:hypothetical protein